MNAIPPPQTSPSLLLLLLLLLLPSSTNAAPLHHSQYLVAAVGAAFNPPFFVGWRQRRVIGAGTSMTSSSCRKIQMATNAPPRVTLSTSMTSPIATTTRFKQDGIRRHPIFLHTNAVSKSMPVPHPHIWRRSLKSQQQQQPCSSPSSRQRHKHSPSLRPLFSLSPKISSPSSSSQIIYDVRIEFTDPKVGARQLLENCGIIHHSISDDHIIGMSDDETNRSRLMAEAEDVMETMDHLVNVLSYFQSIVSTPSSFAIDDNEVEEYDNNHHPQHVVPRCVARIVSTIGKSGIKCPRWHADHVPVRLVMSFIGPGCDYVQEEMVGGVGSGGDTDSDEGGRGEFDHRHPHESPPTTSTTITTSQRQQREVIVNRQALNNLDEEDTLKANNIIVKTIELPPNKPISSTDNQGADITCCSVGVRVNNIATIHHAKEGEAVLLMGKGWEVGVGDDNKNNALEVRKLGQHHDQTGEDGSYNWSCSDNDAIILAAVHRSPKLKPNQERILLTVDLA